MFMALYQSPNPQKCEILRSSNEDLFNQRGFTLVRKDGINRMKLLIHGQQVHAAILVRPALEKKANIEN